MKALLVFVSHHHNNTEKIANAFAKVLDAQMKTPQQIDPEELQEYSPIGFGSGIYAAKHHKLLLDLADELPQVNNNHSSFQHVHLKDLKKITRHSRRNYNRKGA